MTVFQLLMLGASAFFAFKIFEHIQTLQNPQEQRDDSNESEEKSADTFSPFDPAALVEKADIAFEEKDFQRALALLIEADAKDPQNADILFKIAYILQQTNDNDEALKYYKQAVNLDKDNEYIHNSMASIYRANGEFTSAKLHLHASLEIDDSNPITYYNFGNLLVDMNHKEEAKDMYQKALDINPDFDEAKEELEKL
ncbi:tetratricopeptide repeat protein [Sulfurimonas sp.]|uniref:tetratricopeptide repeat protein n=1 Tax=Sulfurimonas sp. TaxID=2022749 RepID=UPI0025E4E75F|nr:tetratricopeptide repeat protein [Sulfurimonas sp.]